MPTFNFGSFIPATLASILEQDGADEIQIVVVDGASTDNTTEIMSVFCKRNAQIKYIRLPERGGIDRDMSTAVEAADGAYCWIFSSDDIMSKGSLRRILSEIESGDDIYLCKHIECSFNMEPLFEWPVLKSKNQETFELADPRTRQRYFRLAQNTEAFFGFMSGLIIKRTSWSSVPLNESFVGSCWAHVARLFEIMQDGLTVNYIPLPLLNRRGGNDSFSPNGVVRRFKLTVDGYHRLANHFFGPNSIEAYHIRRVVRNELNIRQFLYAKVLCSENPEIENKLELDQLMKMVYQDPSLAGVLGGVVYRLFPVWPWFIKPLRAAVRAVHLRP